MYSDCQSEVTRVHKPQSRPSACRRPVLQSGLIFHITVNSQKVKKKKLCVTALPHMAFPFSDLMTTGATAVERGQGTCIPLLLTRLGF